jgi:serine/threonine protein phosphatase 1
MNLIGDIQGKYRTLLALLKQMPDDDPVSVGDMIDRGPHSMEVLEFFRNHGKALLGNHEHMMLDYFCDSGN